MGRGVGSAGSSSRDAILRATQELMLEQGYAAVTFRAVGTRAGVAAGLVQYYFPALDELFIAVLRTGTDRILEHLATVPESDQPLRTLWNYAHNREGTRLLMEFIALANHRKAVAPVIGEGGERVRQAQLAALREIWPRYEVPDDRFTPAALLFLMSGIPRMVHLEEAFGTFTGHTDAIALVEQFLDRVEPTTVVSA